MPAALATFRPPGVPPADPFVPFTGAWTARSAAHLLRRAGFGASPAELARVAALTNASAVAEMLHVADRSPEAAPGPTSGRLLPDDPSPAERDARLASRATAWLDRMVSTPAPLREKLTLFLHGHFATAANEKDVDPEQMVDQIALLRAHALGNWRDLTLAVSRDPAMLKWLDGAQSVAAHPNENFARELLELFTLGVGNYGEDDVRESARAFTGYTLEGPQQRFRYDPAKHDAGFKRFFRVDARLDGDQVITAIFSQRACARFFARKLLAFFVYDDPEPELVETFAGIVVEHDFTMRPVMAKLLMSNVFHSPRAYRALVSSPIEYVVGAYRLLEARAVEPGALDALSLMGQVPLAPPSVKGWDGGVRWLSTQSVLARESFARDILRSRVAERSWLGLMPVGSASAAAASLDRAVLHGDAGEAALAEVGAFLDGRDMSGGGELSMENREQRLRDAVSLLMATPTYQLV